MRVFCVDDCSGSKILPRNFRESFCIFLGRIVKEILIKKLLRRFTSNCRMFACCPVSFKSHLIPILSRHTTCLYPSLLHRRHPQAFASSQFQNSFTLALCQAHPSWKTQFATHAHELPISHGSSTPQEAGLVINPSHMFPSVTRALTGSRTFLSAHTHVTIGLTLVMQSPVQSVCGLS